MRSPKQMELPVVSLYFIAAIVAIIQVLLINNWTDKTVTLRLHPLSLALTQFSLVILTFIKKVEMSLIYYSQNYLNVWSEDSYIWFPVFESQLYRLTTAQFSGGCNHPCGYILLPENRSCKRCPGWVPAVTTGLAYHIRLNECQQ